LVVEALKDQPIMGHNPGGIFGRDSFDPRQNERIVGYRPYQPPTRPIDYSYSHSQARKKKEEKVHDIHGAGNPKCWCGHEEIRKVTINMSECLWCDWGNHPYSALDENRHRLSESKQVKDDEYGGRKEVTTIVDVCGPCWTTRNPFQTPGDTAGEIPESTPDTRDESYLKGYREGVIKGETIK
jgi:hypothetical protein